MLVIWVILSLFSSQAKADIQEELVNFNQRDNYILTYSADRTFNQGRVTAIFGPVNISCGKLLSAIEFFAGAKYINCNDSYNIIRANRSIVFAAQLLHDQGFRNIYSVQNFDVLKEKSVKIYESEFRFFGENN